MSAGASYLFQSPKACLQVSRTISKHLAQTDDIVLTALKDEFEQQASIQEAIAKTTQGPDDTDHESLPAALKLRRGALANAQARAKNEAAVSMLHMHQWCTNGAQSLLLMRQLDFQAVMHGPHTVTWPMPEKSMHHHHDQLQPTNEFLQLITRCVRKQMGAHTCVSCQNSGT